MDADARFATTRWSLVNAAGADVAQAGAALTDLCTAYWYPLYAFARRRGSRPEEAQDLTQGFFAAVLEKGYLRQADARRGRFRTFLLTAFRNYASKVHAHDRALKRGGKATVLSLDFERGESRYAREPEDALTPERVFERRFALTLIDRVLRKLEAEHAEAGKSALFDALKPVLVGAGRERTYKDIAAQLETSESNVKVSVHRLRRRFRDVLRAEIADTVSSPADVDDEIRQLRSALAAR